MTELEARRAETAESLLRLVLERSQYVESLSDEEPREREERIAAIEELVAAAGASGADLDTFLAEAALVTDADRLDENADRVLMLTMHNAKGLEFPAVAVAGLEEGMLPHGGSLDDPKRLEEERRLFYVALTRAEKEVLLTAAAYRRRWDGSMGGQISRFVEEIPEELLEREESAGAYRRPGSNRWGGESGRWRDRDREGQEHDHDWDHAPARSGGRTAAAAPMPSRANTRHRAVGRAVHHEQFGRGVVQAVEGEGESARYLVRFSGSVKKVLGRFLSGGDDGDPA